jgi:xanthine/CO dehydrogenase XdhC/CoxF family maturation factor
VRADELADPVRAVRQACGGEFSLTIRTKGPPTDSTTPRLAIGQRIYSDRDFVFRKIPHDLLDLPRIATAVERLKSDSAMALEARAPVRVYVAFAKRGFSPAWLDPQPGWQLHAAGGLDTTIVQIGRGMDIYCRDFEAGKLRLFEGKRGAYVLLGIQSKTPLANGPLFVAEEVVPSLGGLCAELTEQPGRRLVHLVNYREGLPFRDVAVTVRLPAGKHATAVALASPEHKDDEPLRYDQQGDRASFHVPQIGVYEIAVVTFGDRIHGRGL